MSRKFFSIVCVAVFVLFVILAVGNIIGGRVQYQIINKSNQLALDSIKDLKTALESLRQDGNNSPAAGETLKSDLSRLEQEMEGQNLSLSRTQKRVKILLALAAVMFLGVIILFLPKKDSTKPSSGYSPQIIPAAKLKKDDIQGLAGMMELIVKEISRDKDELINLTKQAYKGQALPNHSVNVAVLAIRVGLGLGMDKEKLILLGISALLHDIGLSKMPEESLSKQTKLSRQEFQLIKGHPAMGMRILEDIGGIEEEIKSAISGHHERPSGVGYPQGLKDEQIHLFAKIIGLVDIYEALTHPRIYRQKCFTQQEAIDELLSLDKQSFFDRRILTVFLKQTDFPQTADVIEDEDYGN